jgi:hypothetical protein
VTAGQYRDEGGAASGLDIDDRTTRLIWIEGAGCNQPVRTLQIIKFLCRSPIALEVLLSDPFGSGGF